MIHGGCVTVGCIPVGDEAIEELFCLVAAVGKAKTTVVISPYDMRNGRIAALEASPHHWYGALCDEIYMKLVNRHVGEFNPPNACSRILRNRL
jgi:murein L,D-transpeptidase YafK